MDLSETQITGVKEMLQKWLSNKTHELEVTFGRDGGMDADTFLKIIRRLKEKGFTEVNSNSDEKLNILCESGLRFTINSFADIQEYCKDDILDGKGWLAIVKKKIDKQSADDTFRDTIDVDEYGVRIKTREEHDRGNSDTMPRHQDVDKAFEGWANLNKAFRLIKRWSFQKNGIQFDLSMVRSTSSTSRGYKWTKKFNDEKFARNEPTYEIEVELLREKLTDNELAKINETNSKEERNKRETTVYINRLITGIGEVLRGIQRNTILITKSIKSSVKKEYAELAGTSEFRGVKPSTLLIDNMRAERTTGQANIRDGYNVTDKADGLRVHAFVNSEGNLYMIDMALNVYSTALNKRGCANSLLDCEWVTKLRNGRSTQQLLIFDVYHFNNKKIWNLPFYEKPKEGRQEDSTRHAALADFMTAWNEGNGPDVTIKAYEEKRALLLQLSAKKFFFGSKEDEMSIFNSIHNEAFPWQETRIYHTDGLIFTPNSMPLPVKPGATFMEQMKWKPADENTIDFLVMIEKELGTDKVNWGRNPITDTNPEYGYKRLVLYVSSREDEMLNDPRKAILSKKWTVDKGKRRGGYKAVEFSPMNYIDTLASTCYRERQIDEIQNMDFVTSELGEIIQDGSIVEMRYDPANEPGWRWIPMRVRHDKTEKFRRAAGGISNAVKGTMNAEFVANATWNSIYEPVTPSMIRRGTEAPEDDEVRALIAAREAVPRAQVYSAQRKNSPLSEAYMRPMRSFHNDWIKYQVLLKSVLGGERKQKILIDMACGKGGDLHKWEKLMPKFILGIDYAQIDIIDKNNGAYRRMLKDILENGKDKVPDIIFVAGDVTLPIITGAAGRTEEEKKMLLTLFGQNTGGGVTPYVDEFAGILEKGADVISCMFALHYFFKDKTTFNGFLRNVSDCLKVGGYFVGCCFDGKSVFNLLSDLKMGESYVGKQKTELIWTIRKDYEDIELPTDDEGFGKAITVEFASIGMPHQEFLMPWELLVAKMSTIGCELVGNPESIGLSASTNLFKDSYAMAKERKYGLEQFPAIQQFSFMNRWFVFKRMTDGKVVAAPEAEKELPVTLQASAARPGESIGEDVEEAAAGTGAVALAAAPALAAVPAAEKTYTNADVIKISVKAPKQSILGFERNDARRWLSLVIPFKISDEIDKMITYPTIEHFLAGMKFKLCSNQPNRAANFQTTGFYAQSAVKISGAAVEKGDVFYKLLEGQTKLIKDGLLGDKATTFNEGAWQTEKIRLLKYALELRIKKDKYFSDILLAAKRDRKLLISTDAIEPDFNGELVTRKVKGENKLGKALMELVEYTV